jgi:hypothetical protein
MRRSDVSRIWTAAMRRIMIASVEFLVHMGGQAFYLVIEGLEWLFGQTSSREETRAVRRAAHLYWKARALGRRGRPKEAFRLAVDAFSFLRAANPRVTFPQMGYLIVSRLDDLGTKLGIQGAARKECEELLQVYKELQADSTTSSPTLDKTVAWLEYKVSSEPELPRE